MAKTINKIFGVGLSRTGTTSLTHALELLGYRTSHWEDHDEINQHLIQNNFTLSLLEQYDAITDNPIPSIYQELDKAYPNSKFILTVREYDSWLKSVKHHHLINVGPQFPSFNTKLCYGSWYFDEEKFTNTYYAHEAEVRAYFNDRPEDLLVLNIREGDGWEKLCAFLGQPIPTVPFPHQNQMNYEKKQVPLVHPEQRWKNLHVVPKEELHKLQEELDEMAQQVHTLRNDHQTLSEHLEAVYASKSWRLIQGLLWPVRVLTNVWKRTV